MRVRAHVLLSCLRSTFWLKPQNDRVVIAERRAFGGARRRQYNTQKMPSESAKRRQAQKKDRERQRQQQASARKKQQPPKQEEEEEKPQINGAVGACAAAGPVDDVQVKSKAVDKKAAARSCTGELLLLYVRPAFYANPWCTM